jgi:hypothetical protein
MGAPIARGARRLFASITVVGRVMNAALYFELVDAVAQVDGSAKLRVVADRIAATSMHPLERRVLERALRARTEALDLQSHLPPADLVQPSLPGNEPLAAGG